MQADIIEQLGLRVQDVIRPSVERTNLGLYVHRTPNQPLRVELIVEFLERCGRCAGVGIVYCSTVKAVDELHETLVYRVSGGVARYPRTVER